MKKSFKFSAIMYGILATALVSGSAFASHATDAKIRVYVDLDVQKSHAQLQSLKKMDVLGVNLKKHWAEVLVTKEELAQIQALKMPIRKVVTMPSQLTTADSSDKYYTPEQVVKELGKINSQYPSITKLFEAGKTHEQRSIMAVEISAHIGDADKPVVIFNAMHHAREVMTTEVVMHIVNMLTQGYGKDREVTNWLDQYRIVIIPQVNPDGNSLVGHGEPMWRKNAYKYNGEVVGVDLNRNYPAYWNYCNGSDGDPYSEIFRGPSAGSEPETQALMSLESAYKPVVEISYHSYSELILYPSGCSTVKNPSKDLFNSIGQTMNKEIYNDDNQLGQYAVGTVPELLYEADGSDIDWLWKDLGVFAYTIEVNSSDFHPDYKTWRNITIKRQEGGWKALLNRMAASGFRAHVQTTTPDELTYSLKKVDGQQKVAFDTDAPERTFKLRSATGLMYQLTDKGKYEVTFFVNNQPVKTMTITVGDTLVDLGDIVV